MSLRVIELCRSRKFRTHTIKHVIKEMADRASDDGTGIYCSKQTLANDTGLSKTSVKKHTQELLESGLIVETGKYWREGRYTKVYRIVLERVHELEKTRKDEGEEAYPTEVAINTPPKKLGKPVLGTSATPNRPLTVQEPPTREREELPEILNYCFKLAWQAYPDDRKRNREECAKQFKSAVAMGAKPNDIVRAIQAYEQTSRGYTRSKVKFSDNWFRNMNWHQFIEQEALEENNISEAMKASLDRCAKWINDGSELCATISPTQIHALIDAGRVTQHQLVRVGLDNVLEDPSNG